MDTLERADPVAETSIAATITLIGILSLLALAAVGGGTAMILDPSGVSLGIDKWLPYIPVFDSLLVPGWLLVITQGVAPIVLVVGFTTAVRMPLVAGLERRFGLRWPVLGSVVQGVGTVAWVVVQFVTIPYTAPLQIAVAVVGLGLVVLALTPEVRRRYSTPR
jgi:hypothetical protein